MIHALPILLATSLICHAADVLELKNGQRRSGKIVSADEKLIRLEIEIPNPSAQMPPPVVSTAIPRADVQAIDFTPDPDREAVVRSAGVQDIPALEAYWSKFSPWMEMPRSPSGSIACALGNALLATKERPNAKRALELFTLVEEKAWQGSDKARAREGRLRAMTATGKAVQAIEEAKNLAAETEDPEILIEANYLMAQATAKELQAFLKENPRWNIDPYVIDERHRLHNRALELYLYPALFFGSEKEKAARGLWGAVDVYRLSAKNAHEAGLPDSGKSLANLAMETSRDIITLYPATPESKLATEFLASLTPEQRAVNFEDEARKELKEIGDTTSATPTPSPEISPIPKTERGKKNKKNETK